MTDTKALELACKRLTNYCEARCPLIDCCSFTNLPTNKQCTSVVMSYFRKRARRAKK